MNTVEKSISDIIGNFTDPIVVFPGGWGDTLPDWLKETITLERLVENMRALKDGDMTGTDAEACAYLYTLSLTQMPSHDWIEIYLYVAGKVYEKHRTKDSGVTLPDDIRRDKISDYQMGLLKQLKRSIYESRVKLREERERGERRVKREEEVERKKQEQPTLFQL